MNQLKQIITILLLLPLLLPACKAPDPEKVPSSPEEAGWVDRVAPNVSSTSPIDGGTLPLNENITITFDEAMDSSTVTIQSIQLRDASNVVVSGSVTYNNTTHVATFDPTSLTASSNYSIHLSTDVKDAAGNSLASSYSSDFTTSELLSSTTPSNGGTLNSSGNIRLTFTQPMDSSTINTANIKLSDATGDIAGSITYDDSTKTVTFDPGSDLTGGVSYTMTIYTGVRDTHGNSLASNYQFSFSAIIGGVVVFSDDFEGDLGKWSVTNAGGTPFALSTALSYEGSKSLKVGPSSAGANAFDSYTVTLRKVFTTPVKDPLISFWVYEEGNWGGAVGIWINDVTPTTHNVRHPTYLHAGSPRGNNDPIQPGWVKLSAQVKGEITEIKVYFFDVTSSDPLYIDNVSVIENDGLIVNKSNVNITASSTYSDSYDTYVASYVNDNLGTSWVSATDQAENSTLTFNFTNPESFNKIGIISYENSTIQVLDSSDNEIARTNVSYDALGMYQTTMIQLPSNISPATLKLKFSNVGINRTVVREVWFSR